MKVIAEKEFFSDSLLFKLNFTKCLSNIKINIVLQLGPAFSLQRLHKLGAESNIRLLEKCWNEFHLGNSGESCFTAVVIFFIQELYTFQPHSNFYGSSVGVVDFTRCFVRSALITFCWIVICPSTAKCRIRPHRKLEKAFLFDRWCTKIYDP